MMDEALLRRLIKQEIRTQMNVLLFGAAGKNDNQTEQIQGMFPGMDGIDSRPVMHPFGISSRAPSGTTSVIGRMGEHFGNRTVLGHRDANRPTTDSGETILYDAYGHIVYLSKSKIQLGSKGAAEPFVLGLVYQALESKLIQLIAQHTHISNVPGGQSSIPNEFQKFLDLKASPVDDSLILSDEIFGEKGGG